MVSQSWKFAIISIQPTIEPMLNYKIKLCQINLIFSKTILPNTAFFPTFLDFRWAESEEYNISKRRILNEVVRDC